MKKGIHYRALPQDLCLKEQMQSAKRMGFDGLELVILEKGELRLDCSARELAAIRQMALDEQLEICALSNSLNWKCSFTSESIQIRQRAKDMLLRQIEIAAALGVEVVLALPGFVGMDFTADALHGFAPAPKDGGYDPGFEIIHYETAYLRALDAFREIGPVAKQMRVTIGIENIWNQFLLSPMEMRDFIDKIDLESVQAYFDVGNVLPLGHPEQWIRILGSRIKRIHVKDFRKGNPSVSGFVNLLSGDVNFPEIVTALREIGYDGWITAEVHENPAYPEFAAQASALALEYILEERGNGNV